MSDVVPVFVDCWRDGKLLASYEFGYGRAQDGSGSPPDASFVAEAKDNLTNERLARPPYEGIRFQVVR